MPDGTSVGGKTVAEKLNHSLNRLTFSTVLLYAITITMFLVGFFYIRNYVEDNRLVISNTTNALCALKGDLQQRIDSSEAFLKEHPNGLPGTGITAEMLQQQNANTQRTLDALEPIQCPSAANFDTQLPP